MITEEANQRTTIQAAFEAGSDDVCVLSPRPSRPRQRWVAVRKVGFSLLILLAGWLLLLYPRVDLAVRQVGHLTNWEQLIQPSMPEMAEINRLIAPVIPPDCPPQLEINLVQRWVEQQVPYRYDWYQWGNIDYWPTAQEVWKARREDCDGRAVLAASILRARGFTTARLAVNMQHVWIVVEANDPKLKNQVKKTPLAAMNPMKQVSITRTATGRLQLHMPDKALILGTLGMAAEFPAWRSALVLLWLFAVLWFPAPWRTTPQLAAPIAWGMASLVCFMDWSARYQRLHQETHLLELWVAGLLLGIALVQLLRRKAKASQNACIG